MPNYEAIGRCTKLKEEIDALTLARNQAVVAIRRQLHGTLGANAPSQVVYTLDAEQLHRHTKALEQANAKLMAAISEYNEYAAEGEGKPYQVLEPRNN
ncbi:hypothetical protein [Vreelandella olivaria]|uniref:hypothetical protein n=1 Tax=Vreelandella olivaria TaxID=390919 RepID=UPI00201EFB48|nr:hypothetical protein [Halomonas olivaria]